MDGTIAAGSAAPIGDIEKLNGAAPALQKPLNRRSTDFVDCGNFYNWS